MLPIDSHLEKILEILKDSSSLVLSAAPGAGKTTRLPPELLKLTDKKIYVLEPRRIAAVGAASRIAEERNWNLGEEVGYQIRFDSKFKNDTRLIFLTEALLNRKLLQDPELKDVGMIVLDEFHERSVHVDLALGMLKELQELARPDLKLVVMSATLFAEPIAKFLGDCPVYQVPGQSFELSLNLQKTSQKLQTNPDWIDTVKKSVQAAVSSLGKEEHCLVFLPGVGEIERLANALTEWCELNQLKLMKLHGSLSLQEQKDVLKSSKERKIILATNVAESSLTIDGVRIVVDSGLHRQASLDPKTGFPSLNIARISKSSAKQRAGRAARQGPGICFQLWNSLDERSMPEFEVPEILRTELSETLLFLASSGITDFANFSWFEFPERNSMSRAQKLLCNLGAITEKNEITALGKKMLGSPLPPRWGKAMVLAKEKNLEAEIAIMAALMQERDILRGSQDSNAECDLIMRLETVLHSPNRFPNVIKVANQLTKAPFPKTLNTTEIKKLLLEVFSDQLCRRRRKKESAAIMISSQGVTLDEKTQVRDSEFFLALQIMEGKVSLACGIEKKWLEERFKSQIQEKSWVEFDPESGKVLRKTAETLALPKIGSLPLGSERVHPASLEDAAKYLPEIALQAKDEILLKNNELRSWMERFLIFSKFFEIPEITETLWKEIFDEACYQEKSLNALFEKDLVGFVESKLDSTLVKSFHKEAPPSIEVPTGNKIKINYSGSNPTLEVRLQEVFGWLDTPKILGGKVNLTMSLLGPNYRPMQITQDLRSFWQNGYFEVRKELKTRYPKHSWPEDPLSAAPVARGRPRKQ